MQERLYQSKATSFSSTLLYGLGLRYSRHTFKLMIEMWFQHLRVFSFKLAVWRENNNKALLKHSYLKYCICSSNLGKNVSLLSWKFRQLYQFSLCVCTGEGIICQWLTGKESLIQWKDREPQQTKPWGLNSILSEKADYCCKKMKWSGE